MDNISRSHRSYNHRTFHGTVSILLKFALTHDYLSRSAAAAYAASVPPNNQTINQQTNKPATGTFAICTRYATRYATRATAAGGH